jgi:hypothetical protein
MLNEGSLKTESEELLREVKKLEIRLDEYLEDEEAFVQHLRNCISQLKLLCASLEKTGTTSNAEKIEALQLKTRAITTLSEALQKGGRAEHERSHLLESYGALILALQKIEGSCKAHTVAFPKR